MELMEKRVSVVPKEERDGNIEDMRRVLDLLMIKRSSSQVAEIMTALAFRDAG